MALQSQTPSDPCGESTRRREPPAQLPGTESTEVTAAANGSTGEDTAAAPASGSAGGGGTCTHRKGLSPGMWGFLGALVGAVALIIVALINRNSPAPPSPLQTYSVTPGPSQTLSPGPSPSPSPSPTPSPSLGQSLSPTAITSVHAAPLVDPNAHYLIENAGTGTCLSWAWGFSTSAGPSPCIDRADTDG